MNVLTAPGKRLFLTGDEAVARAALEAGVHVATGYPGNPSTKTITALLPIAQQYGIRAEWSVNEKVALEVATGAAWTGKRSLVTMKMSGINVMADSLLSIAHSGVTGALVIYAVDDVGTYYGMVEQDSRHYALLTSLPLLMPASPEEAYTMTHLAFTVSEQTGAPVFLLSTTAVANAITAMKGGPIKRDASDRPASFERNLAKFTKAVPQWCRDQHADALMRLEQAGELFRKVAINRASTGINLVSTAAPPSLPGHPQGVSLPRLDRGEFLRCAQDDRSEAKDDRGTYGRTARRLGIVVAGVSYTYVQEVYQRSPELFADVSLFKVGGVHPLPEQELRDFLAHLGTVLVLEELEPIIETQLLALIAEAGLHVEVSGKRNGLLPRVGDYSLELVEQAVRVLTGHSLTTCWINPHSTASAQDDSAEERARDRPIPVPQRGRPQEQHLPMNWHSTSVAAPPRSLEFCSGCPHRLTYYALNRAIEKLGLTQDEVITAGDIGCTIIGMNAPLDACWTEVSMGASIGIAQGFKYAGIDRPVLAAMGDGTFYHNGIAGLLNAVQSGVNLTLIILDNGRSAMTGMQPDPGTGRRSDGEPSIRADIAMIVRGCGVEYVKKLSPYQLPRMIETLQDAMKHPGVSVVIAEAPCTTQGVLINERPVQVDQDVCLAGRGCEDTPCYHKVGCPSVLLSLDDVRPRLSIDTATCVACGLCMDACPFDAIKPIPVEEGEQEERSPAFAGLPLKYMLQD